MGVNFEEYKSMSEDDLSYLVAEKKAEFQRTKIDLDLAFTSLGQLESREKKALTSVIPASFSQVFRIRPAPRLLQESKTSTPLGKRSAIA